MHPLIPRLSVAAFLLCVLGAGPLGCKPEFTDDKCATDADCFANEQCSAAGVCEALPPVERTPKVLSFTSSAETIVSGDAATLSWSLQDAETASLTSDKGLSQTIPFAQLTTGELEVSPTETTTYTITVNAQGKSDTKALTVAVVDISAPEITSFTADPATIVEGNSTTLTWRTRDAESGTITGDGQEITINAADLAGGSVQVTPLSSTTYTLSITNLLGTATETANVTVQGKPPEVSAFTTSAMTVTRGESVTLGWRLTGADTLTIRDDAGASLDLTGKSLTEDTIEVAINRPQVTFTLEARNAAGPTLRTVTVTSIETLGITSFTATPAAFDPGDLITLQWVIVGAPDAIALVDDQGGTVDVSGASLTSGSVQVSPTATTTYTLTATKGQEMTSATATVTELPDAPVLTTFDASAAEVSAGDTVTLSWQAANAAEITLVDGDGNTVDLTGKDPNNDSVDVTVNASATYTLTVKNLAGEASSAVTITVGALVAITAFTASPMMVLAGDDVTLTWATTNASAVTITSSDNTPVNLTGKTVAGDSVVVAPLNASVTYTLTAQGFGGPVTQQVNISTTPRATINTFTASSISAPRGQSVDLTWSTTDAASITLDATVGGTTTAVDLTGKATAGDTITVTPTDDTTYTLTATGSTGDQITATVDVDVFDAATLGTLTANTTSTRGGDPVVLTWTATNATGVLLLNSFGQSVPLPGGVNPNGDSVTVRPQVSTTYTLLVTGDGSSQDQQTVAITVAAAELYITELFVNATGADDGLEWVEIFNNSKNFVDLSHYTIGAGTSDYTATTHALTGVVAPGQCVVIGGPTRSGANGNPTYFEEHNFDPDLPDGGAAAHGVGLFFNRPVLAATDAPIDAVVYGDANTAGLLNEQGVAKTDLSPTPISNRSLRRASLDHDTFTIESTPRPGGCFGGVSVQTTRAPSASMGLFTFKAFGYLPELYDVTLGNAALTCTPTGTPGEFSCPVTGNAAVTGDQTLTFVQAREYIEDASGAPTTFPLAAADQVTTPFPGAFRWEATLSDGAVDSFFCGILDPPSALTGAPGATFNVEAEIYLAGSTNVGNLPASYVVQAALVGDGTATPDTLFDAQWVTATFARDAGSNDVYTAPITSASALSAQVGYRVSPDNGLSFYYCDRSVTFNGSDNDWTSGGGLPVSWQ